MTGSPPWSVQDLAADLERLGVRRGETLMVHASLRKIGKTEGGGAGVVAALDAAVGPEGTLLMILGAQIDHEWVNARPEAERPGLLADVAPYDPWTAPVLPEVGALAEVFRTLDGTIVDDNPSGRFAARGACAAELLADLPWDDYYGPGSPLQRLVDGGGRVLRLGANPETVTALHYAEYLADVPGKRRVRRHYRVSGPSGPETRSVECLDDEHGIVDWPTASAGPEASGEDDYFAVIVKRYLAAGRGLRGRDAELLDAADVVSFGARWMREHLRP
jgi:aminoglycoside N3'-acetyltransferase